ncbi:spermidine synthase [Mumia sp. Pv 4-285]|uniref:spermidine synthase n=1 Tax=Mumia qirimensis TaxID=3234852 RepID=UPI00351D4894
MHTRGDAVVRRREDGALELRVNGVFVMDDVETTSERLLARAALAGAANPRHVVVGGLGMGFTLREILTDRRVAQVTVAELEPAIPEFMREGTLPGADLLADRRVDLHVDDVREVVRALGGRSVDVILLDVDNGPDFLVHDRNAAVYEAPFVADCAARLSDLGELCIWSMDDSAPVRDALAASFDHVYAEQVPVRLQGRAEAYWLLRGRVPQR